MPNYNTDAIVAPGSDIFIKSGLTWPGGQENVAIFTGNVDEKIRDVKVPERAITLRSRDNCKRLKLKSEFTQVFQSQQRFWDDFTYPDDDKKLDTTVTAASKWEQIEEWFRAYNYQNANFAVAGWYDEYNVWLMAYTALSGSSTNAKTGLIWRIQTPCCSDCYGAIYEASTDKISIYKRTNSVWGTALASSSALGWHAGPWYEIIVLNVEDKIYVFTSTDAITYTLAVSYSDTDPLGPGLTGLYAYPAAYNYIYLDNLLFRNVSVDLTVEDVACAIAGKAGIRSFKKEAAFEENFDNQFQLWPYKTGTWTISSNRLVGSSSSGWSFLRSGVTVTNFIADFSMSLPTNGQAGFLLCCGTSADATNTNYYIVEVDQAGYIKIHRCQRGNLTKLLQIPLSWITIPTNKSLQYRISYQDGFVSLWCEGILLVSFWDFQIPFSGYFGFAVASGTSNALFDSLRISKLNKAVTQWPVNADESYFDNLVKLVGDETGAFFFDGDGAFVIGNLVPSSGVVDCFTTRPVPIYYTQVMESQFSESDLDWFSVCRVDGANGTATYRDEDLLKKGYRFEYIKDQNLQTDDECYLAAQNAILQQKRKMIQESFNLDIDIRLENRDRIHIVDNYNGIDEDFIVDGVSFTKSRETMTMNVGIAKPYVT